MTASRDPLHTQMVRTLVPACCRLPAAGLAKEGSALIRALSGLPKLGRWGKNREVTVLQPVLETTQVVLKTA